MKLLQTIIPDYGQHHRPLERKRPFTGPAESRLVALMIPVPTRRKVIEWQRDTINCNQHIADPKTCLLRRTTLHNIHHIGRIGLVDDQ